MHPLTDLFTEGAQRSLGVLDVACVIDYQGQNVNLIVSGNTDVSNQKFQEVVLVVWEGLKRISNAALTVTTHTNPSEYCTIPIATRFSRASQLTNSQKTKRK